MTAPITKCPRCGIDALHFAQSEDVTLHACDRCGGVWLPTAPAARLIAPLAGDFHSADPQGVVLSCPACHAGMEVTFAQEANVYLDRCPAHGTWFDRHELEHVAAAVARLRGTAAPSSPEAWPRLGQAGPHRHNAGAPSVGTAVAGIAAGGAVTALLTLDQQAAQRRADDENSALDLVEPAVHGIDLATAAVEGVAEVARSSEAVTAVLEVGPAVGEAAGGMLEGMAGLAEVGSTAAEIAGGALELVGTIFEVIAGLFS